jgi:hypothetical protein
MAQDVGIYLTDAGTAQKTFSHGVGVNAVDILFAPGGGLVERGAPSDSVILWVRDLTLDDPFQGEPVLIAIYSRTGFIAAQPVAPGSDPYAFTKDGRSSGL